MRVDERIPNLVSEFKSDSIWPLLDQNTGKLAELGILPVFDRFMAKKGVKCYPICILRPDFESSHQGDILDHKIKGDWKLYFFGPHTNFKTEQLVGMTL